MRGKGVIPKINAVRENGRFCERGRVRQAEDGRAAHPKFERRSSRVSRASFWGEESSVSAVHLSNLP
jgi:hypothetical protein